MLLALYPRVRRDPGRLAVIVAIAVLIVGVAYSFSRSSYFGALAVLAVFAVRRPVRVSLISAAVAVCVIPVLPPAVSARIGTVWSSNGLDASSVARLDLWRSALHMFIHQPILGVGYLHFSGQLPVYFQNTNSSYIPIAGFAGLIYAHNIYLTVLSQTGLIGFFLVGALVVGGWRGAWSAMRAGDWAGESAVLAFVGIGVGAVFGDPFFQAAVLAAFMLVILAGRHPGEVSNARSDSDRTGLSEHGGTAIDARTAVSISACASHTSGR